MATETSGPPSRTAPRRSAASRKVRQQLERLPRKPVTQLGRYHRSTMSAGRTLAVVLLALLLGGLLNVTSLTEAAERQPGGVGRDVSMVLVWPFRQVSSLLGLDQPRALLTERLGRNDDDNNPGAGKTDVVIDTDAAGDVEVDTEGRAVEPLRSDALAAAAAIAGRQAIDPEAVAIPTDLDPGARALQEAAVLPDRLQQEFTSDNPLRVAVIGDSLTEQLGPAIIDHTNDTNVAAETTHDFTYSSGLSRPDFFDWTDRAAELAEEADPDLWIVMLGANDAQDVRDEQDRFRQIGTDEWEEIYVARVSALMEELTEDGRAVIWVGQPVMRSAEFDDSMAYISGLYRRQAEARSLVSFVDAREIFDDPQGGYADYLPDDDGQLVQMRLGDGIHLTRRGATRLADQLIPLLPLVEGEQDDTEPSPERSE